MWWPAHLIWRGIDPEVATEIFASTNGLDYPGWERTGQAAFLDYAGGIEDLRQSSMNLWVRSFDASVTSIHTDAI